MDQVSVPLCFYPVETGIQFAKYADSRFGDLIIETGDLVLDVRPAEGCNTWRTCVLI